MSIRMHYKYLGMINRRSQVDAKYTYICKTKCIFPPQSVEVSLLPAISLPLSTPAFKFNYNRLSYKYLPFAIREWKLG